MSLLEYATRSQRIVDGNHAISHNAYVDGSADLPTREVVRSLLLISTLSRLATFSCTLKAYDYNVISEK